MSKAQILILHKFSKGKESENILLFLRWENGELSVKIAEDYKNNLLKIHLKYLDVYRPGFLDLYIKSQDLPERKKRKYISLDKSDIKFTPQLLHGDIWIETNFMNETYKFFSEPCGLCPNVSWKRIDELGKNLDDIVRRYRKYFRSQS